MMMGRCKMGNQIIKQPDGLYAVFSSIVDGFVMYNCTPQEIVNEWVKEERIRLTESVKRIIEALDAGEKPYHQFTMSWAEALAEHECRHGKLELAKTEGRLEKK
jgi:hypothetical protein